MKQLEEHWRQHYEPQRVSVIIPTYNRARVVVNAINSVLAQPHPKVEIIVVDDGSSDETPAVLAGIPGLKIIRQVNQGVGAARNTGLMAATGEYIANLDSDDVWHDDFLPVMLAAMQKHECKVGISARERKNAGALHPVRDTPIERKFLPSQESVVLLGAAELRLLSMASVMSTNPGVVLHRSVVEPWPDYLRTIDDVGQHARVILRHGPGAVFVTTPLWEVSPGGQDEVSLVGRNDRCDLGWRVSKELAAIEQEMTHYLSKSELQIFARKRGDWLVGDSAYPLSVKGRVLPALQAYLGALTIDFRVLRARELAAGFIRSLRAFRANLMGAKPLA